ncbi:LacI family DNA-binding transcriptional regulator [Agromyces aurantiacus]|uniref:LacI family DNA-binding transcriptional regulator n=1 Tax=Agromyces aurantiacus TaxID=165814 RepID=A0ABV9R707_9MICO|nr:LacI family DNA-binding transcriptional regulator [Agromyces aurantiacus]MBM7503959.1 DNA-binding LacI/PurR family transcriptional regulator [Agromyces aurantiacus]
MGATLHDVARVAGVSIKTVSNVVNDYPHVRPQTRERVLSAIRELGYRPNVSARGLRSGRTGVIGLAVPALRENYFAELADAVIRAAERRGLSVLIEQTNGDREKELQSLSGGRLHLTDGLLFSPVSLAQADADALDVPIPLVLLGERIFGGPTDHVTMHNVSSARAAVEHLLDLGRTRIALIGAPPAGDAGASSGSLRLDGYRQALHAAGVAEDPRLIRVAQPWNRETGAAATWRMIDEGVPFDAVFALNDTLGLGVLRALGEAELRVPEDVAVIAFDNIDESRFSVPSLSSVDPGRDQIAEMAVDMLLERIQEKGERRPPRQMKPDFRIVVRESTVGASSPHEAGGAGADVSGARSGSSAVNT